MNSRGLAAGTYCNPDLSGMGRSSSSQIAHGFEKSVSGSLGSGRFAVKGFFLLGLILMLTIFVSFSA
jgi:hypothetical protein